MPAKVRDQAGQIAQADPMAESAGVLLRVSSSGQDEENQRPELEAYCDDHGYRVNREYQLHDKSAFHGEQEQALAEILEDIRTGVIKVLVVVHSSRIDRRDLRVAMRYGLAIDDAGGRIESVREPMFGKWDDVAGEITTLLAYRQNHDYSKTLAGHIRAGHERVRTNRAAGKGGLLGRAPWGYQITGERYLKTIVPTPLGLKYIPEVFSQKIDGRSLAAIAAWLNSEGVPTGCKVNKRGEPTKGWSASTVGQVIRNTAYKGQQRDKAGNYVSPCEAIVSAAVWNKANAMLDSAPTRSTGPRTGYTMLSGVGVCEHCGSPLHKSKGETRLYYRCSGKLAEGGESCFMVRLEAVDDAVSRVMAANPQPVMKLTLIPGKDYSDELDAIEAQVRALRLGQDDYAERYAALTAEWQRLHALDITPDEWRMLPTSQTWGQLWSALDASERGRWLARQGFTVRVSKAAVTVAQGELEASTELAPAAAGKPAALRLAA